MKRKTSSAFSPSVLRFFTVLRPFFPLLIGLCAALAFGIQAAFAGVM
jgi:hypothetical protein